MSDGPQTIGLTALALALALVLCGCPAKPAGGITTGGTEQPAPLPEGRQTGTVVQVYDGGAVRVRLADQSEVTVLLAGIRAPAKGSHEREGDEPWGARASQELSVTVAWREVEIETEDIFSGNRESVWGYLWLDGKLVNEQLLATGEVVPREHRTTLRHADRLAAAAAKARERKYGLWSVGPENVLQESGS